MFYKRRLSPTRFCRFFPSKQTVNVNISILRSGPAKLRLHGEVVLRNLLTEVSSFASLDTENLFLFIHFIVLPFPHTRHQTPTFVVFLLHAPAPDDRARGGGGGGLPYDGLTLPGAPPTPPVLTPCSDIARNYQPTRVIFMVQLQTSEELLLL